MNLSVGSPRLCGCGETRLTLALPMAIHRFIQTLVYTNSLFYSALITLSSLFSLHLPSSSHSVFTSPLQTIHTLTYMHKHMHTYTHKFTHSDTCSFIHSLTHSFIHSLTHSITQSINQSINRSPPHPPCSAVCVWGPRGAGEGGGVGDVHQWGRKGRTGGCWEGRRGKGEEEEEDDDDDDVVVVIVIVIVVDNEIVK